MWLLPKYKNSFFLSRFALLILDLSPEAAAGGVLHKKLFFEILQNSLEKSVLECLHKSRLFLIIDITVCKIISY